MNQENLIHLTSDIVSAFVSNNPVPANDLTEIMRDVHGTIVELAKGKEPRPDPAVPINKSVHRNYIICLEDGAKMKMLKRYLRTHFNMSPDEYRERWGLPHDYPMVCEEYSERRSQFAKDIGLGKN